MLSSNFKRDRLIVLFHTNYKSCFLEKELLYYVNQYIKVC